MQIAVPPGAVSTQIFVPSGATATVPVQPSTTVRIFTTSDTAVRFNLPGDSAKAASSDLPLVPYRANLFRVGAAVSANFFNYSGNQVAIWVTPVNDF